MARHRGRVPSLAGAARTGPLGRSYPRRVPPPRDSTRWLLFAVSLVVALGAIPVGIGFVLFPDGSMVGLPVELLAGTPFRDFRIPGALLAFAVGGSSLASAVLTARRHRYASETAFLAGTVVVGWIGVQVLLIGLVSALQPMVGALGVALIGMTWRSQLPAD
jgi:hypothetical protein